MNDLVRRNPDEPHEDKPNTTALMKFSAEVMGTLTALHEMNQRLIHNDPALSAFLVSFEAKALEEVGRIHRQLLRDLRF